MHTAAALFISQFVWLFLAINNYLKSGFSDRLYLPALIIAATFLLTTRLYRVGARAIAKDDQEFLLIMNTNKKKIREAWKLTEKNKPGR
jgi:hypothetical protein